jgi:ketosteroid isomerase-like protein
MGTSNIEIVRASYEALNRGDVAAALDALAPDVEWHESSVLPERDIYRGRESVRGLLQDFQESWDEFHQDLEDAVEREDKVAVFIHLSAKGRESGAEVDARYAHVWTMRDGKGVRVDGYYDREEARRAVEEPLARRASTKP